MRNIIIKNLSRRYGDLLVLKDVSLNIDSGDKVILHGKNGSGKSTFLRILATLLAPTEGSVQLGMYDLSTQYDHARKQISWAPSSDRGFSPRFSGIQNLYYYCSIYKTDRVLLETTLNKLKHIVPLQLALETPYYLCSSGMKQSLNLTRALIRFSDFIFLDEPFRNLDRHTREEFLKYFESLNNSTMVFSDHGLVDNRNSNFRSIKISEGLLL